MLTTKSGGPTLDMRKSADTPINVIRGYLVYARDPQNDSQ